MGLNHPHSLEDWQRWQDSRHRARRAKHALAGALRRARPGVRGAEGADGTGAVDGPGAADGPVGTDPVSGAGAGGATAAPASALVLVSRGSEGGGTERSRTLICLDSASPTSRASLLSVLPYLTGGIDVLAPVGLDLPEVAGPGWAERRFATLEQAAGAAADASPTAVVSIGQHLAAGAAAHRIARDLDLPEYVVQHGVLTPFAPPLPEGATLLAWSDADVEFWTGRRADTGARTVGSQLLWQAAHEAERSPRLDSVLLGSERPVFLGQLHGAELARRVTGGAALRFCREHGGLYRPHPAETDVLSRAQHRLWRRRGIAFADTDAPLRDLPNPVVSVFSTGVLEAAARGSDAWVFAPAAPAWVHELWERYDMRPYGADPTPSPVPDAEEPAARIARILEEGA